MKSLGVMFVAAFVLTVPTVGVAAGEYDDTIARIAELRGFNFTAAQLEAAKVASVTFPVSADGFTATMNWVTNDIVVDQGMTPDNGAQAGCVNSGLSAGWARTPVAVGCTGQYESHQGGIKTQTLACAGGGPFGYCLIDGFNLGGFFDFVLFQCFPIAGAAVDSIDWATGAQSTGQCDAFNFAFVANPPDYAGFDSIVAGDGSVFVGLDNW